MFYDNYVRLCAQNGLTPSAAAKEIGVNKAAVSNWKYRKNNPSDVTIQKIADYFGVPISALIGETDKKEKPTREGELDAETMELRAIWDTADEEERQALLQMARLFKKRRDK